MNWRPAAGDWSAAFADLGTFLPLVLGVVAVGGGDATGMLVGFGLFAIATGVIYRRPVPVQPMKAVAALVIAGAIGSTVVTAANVLIGVILCALAAVGLVGRFGAWIPRNVMHGIQFGVGLYLMWSGLGLVLDTPLQAFATVVFVLLLQRTVIRPLAVPLVLAAGVVWQFAQRDLPLPPVQFGWHALAWHWPSWHAFTAAAVDVVLPQLALTLTNATVITAAIAASYFPQDQQRITPDRLAWSTGVLNLLLAPLGGFPTCHGAGGLVVQRRFGGETGWTPAIFGSACLLLGLTLGDDALQWLGLVPLAILGALLIVAGADLAWSRRPGDYAMADLLVIVLIGVSCVLLNVAAGLLIGLLLDRLRRYGSSRRPSQRG